MSLQGNKSLDINSDNVNRWVQGKFEAMLRTPDTRNQIREIVDSKVEAYQVFFPKKFPQLFRKLKFQFTAANIRPALQKTIKTWANQSVEENLATLFGTNSDIIVSALKDEILTILPAKV